MAVNIKMGVDMSGFKSGIADANAQLKTFDAQLKFAETAMKQAGNAEQGLITKTNALEGKLKTQKQMLQQYTQQLERMREAGVDPLSRDYQKLQAAMLNTRTSMMETEAALNGLSDSQVQAATTADKLTNSMNGLNKKVSLEMVTSAITSITRGLERAAQKAVDLGQKLWDTIMDSAKRADDTATMAEMFGIDLQQFKKMQALVGNGMDTTVDQMLNAQDRLKRGIGNSTKATMDTLRELKLLIPTGINILGKEKFVTDDTVDLFFRAGQAILAMGEAYDKEAAASALFGESWKELKPLFDTYKTVEEYNEAVKNVTVSSEDSTRNLAELNDAVAKLETTWTSLKDEILGAIAPALEGAANALTGLLEKVLEYLNKPEGQKALEDMGKAVEGLFEDLGKIDPEKVVENFASLFNGVVNSFEWLKNNWGDVKTALAGIAGGFALLKISTLALNIKKVVDGLGDLFGGGGGGSPTTTGTDGGGGGLTSLLAGSSVIQKIGSAATSLSMADPTGLTAFLPQALADNTEFGWRLTHGSTLGEAAEASWNTIKASAKEGMGNFGKYFTEDLPNAFWGAMGFKNAGEAAEAFSGVMNQTGKNIQTAGEWTFGDEMTAEEAMALINAGESVPIKIDPIAPEDAAGEISSEIGEVPITLVIRDIEGSELEELLGPGHANGLSYVPNNGLYLLHKGEQVVSAREVASRSYSSNLYVESMYMNNGTDAEGLASAMAAAQRRTMSGYGS